jgi:membrane protein DedA with SNARE-associated domain/membrane-associated phospholipid phosphatase
VIERLIEDLAGSLGQWAYLLVAGLAMAETAAFLGFVAPGEFAVIFGGVLAGEGTLSIQLLIGIVWASVVAGDTVGFLIGRRFGRGFAERHGPKVRLTEERLRKVEDYFARHGGKTIFVGRWIGIVRPLMPFTAGTSGMSYRRFLPYDVLGAGTWSATFCLLGYIFWRSFTQIANVAGKGTLAFGIAVALFVGIYQAIKHLRRPDERARFAAWVERQGRRPLLRPLAALARLLWRVLLRPLWRYLGHPVWRAIVPPARFLIARITPGELGIELTTLLAIATVSIYVLVLQINLLGDHTLIWGDGSASDIARDARTGVLTTVAKTVTALGAFWVVLPFALGAGFYLLYRQQAFEAVALWAGFATAEIAVQIIKAAVDRPRPVGGLVGADGWAYPSGHAALGVTYLAVAVVLARAGPVARRASIVAVGLAIAVLIGVSRVYLNVHHLSDVVGGWALGLAAYSVCGTVALVVHYLRYNLRGSGAVAPRESESISG